jgi:hypothetical protein
MTSTDDCAACLRHPSRVERPAATDARKKKLRTGGSARTRGWAACVYVLCKMMR